MTTLLQAETPAPEAAEPVRVYSHPREQVDRVDALSCEATATRRIDKHCVCDYHEREVLLAYWGTDANLILHNVSDAEGYHCGQTYTSREVTR